MLIWALLFLVVVLLFLQPWVEEWQERKLAERLKDARSAAEAQAMLDGAMYTRREEITFIERVREWVYPFLFR
jgi:hypothetical protein